MVPVTAQFVHLSSSFTPWWLRHTALKHICQTQIHLLQPFLPVKINDGYMFQNPTTQTLNIENSK